MRPYGEIMTSPQAPAWLIATIVSSLLLMACGGTTLDTTSLYEETPIEAEESGMHSLITSNGESFSFDSVAGEPTVVWFWGPG